MTDAAAAGLSEAGDAFERALFRLALGHGVPQRVESVDGDLAVVFDAQKRRRTVLLRVRDDLSAAVLDRLTALLRRLSRGAKGSAAVLGPVDVVVLGGDPSLRASLKRTLPSFTVTRVTLYHLAQGDPMAWRDPGFFGGRVSALPFAFGVLDAGYDRAALERKIAEDARLAALESKELSPFLDRVVKHKGTVTVGLLVLTAVGFFLERRFQESQVTLVRMGAMVGKLAFHGEWWRFGAYVFLHMGWVHFALNGFVLLVLGKWVEGVFGSWRFLLLYGVAGLGGGVASGAVHPEQITVGASGAIWGLFCAQGVLAYLPRGILPGPMIPAAKRAARQNLMINLGISFLPGVSMAAHLGGGLVGVGLVLSGALTRGLPRSTEVADDGAAKATAQSPAGVACALAVGAFLVASLAVGIARGGAWSLADPPVMARRMFTSGVALELPAQLEPAPPKPLATGAGGVLQSFGNGLTDPATVTVLVLPEAAPLDLTGARTAEIEKQFSVPPKNTKLLHGLVIKKNINGQAFFIEFKATSGAVYERGVAFLPDATLVVDSLSWPDLRQYRGLPERVLRSLSRVPVAP